MSDEQRRRWENRHRRDDPVGIPSTFVTRALDAVNALGGRTTLVPRALDVACGRGRHALLLAERGYHVDAVDFSLPALRQLKQDSAELHPALHCLVADVTTWPIPSQRYDVVVVVSFLERGIFAALREAVIPGGALVYETHTRDQTGLPGDLRPEFTLEPGELEHVCRGWRILLTHADVSMHGMRRVARAGILAQRPLDSSSSTPTH